MAKVDTITLIRMSLLTNTMAATRMRATSAGVGASRLTETAGFVAKSHHATADLCRHFLLPMNMCFAAGGL